MTDTSKEAVERLLDGVTPGRAVQFHPHYCPEAVGTPFSVWDSSHDLSVIRADGGSYRIATFRHARDAAFHQVARELVPALLADREALTAEVARLTAALDETEALEEQHGAVIARLTAALAQSSAETQAALAGCVKIKPLVWFEVEKYRHGGKYTAEGYTIRYIEGVFILDFAGDSKSAWRFPTLEAAQAAAQADYDARIRAAIQIDITLQQRANEWALACFGAEIVADKTERTHRFLEEALELAQACGCTKSEVTQLVDYVFARNRGDVAAEVGDVLNTIAMLCTAHGIDMEAAGHEGLDRCWANIDKTRAKHAAKPRFSPLPVAIQPDTSKLALVREAFGNLVNHDVFQDEEYLSEDLIAKLIAARAALAAIGEEPRHD